MGAGKVITRRLGTEIIIALVWFEFLTSIIALGSEGWLEAALGIAVGVGLLLILANKRLLETIEERQLKRPTIPILVVVVLVFAVFEFRNLRFQNLVLSGELQVLELIRILRAAGSLVLAVAILLEVLRLPRRSA